MRRLWRSAAITSTSTAMRVGLGLVASKLIAVTAGPAGVGLASLVRQLSVTAVSLATLGGPNGVVQGLARGDLEHRESFLRTTAGFFAAGTLLAAVILVFGAPWLAPLLFSDGVDRTWLVRWAALPVALGAAAAYLESLARGHHALRRLGISQVAAAAAAASLAYPVGMALAAGEQLPVIAWVAAPGAASAVILGFCAWKAGWLSGIRSSSFLKFHSPSWRRFLSFTPAMLVTAAAGLVPILVIRVAIGHESLETLGLFDAGWTLGTAYLGIILSTFSTFYFPQLAALRDGPSQSVLATQVLRFTAGVGLPIIVLVMNAKWILLQLGYTREFAGAFLLLRWTLLGDYIRLAGWVVGMPLQANGDARGVIVSEAVSAVFFTSLAFALAPLGWLNGVGIAYVAVNMAYTPALAAFVARRHGIRLAWPAILRWLLGLAIAVAASVATWAAPPSPIGVVGLLGVAAVGGAILLGRDGWHGLRRQRPPGPTRTV